VFVFDQLGEILEQAPGIEQGDVDRWHQRHQARLLGVGPQDQAATLGQAGTGAGQREVDLVEERRFPRLDRLVVTAYREPAVGLLGEAATGLAGPDQGAVQAA
jgi:hypothetical protein